jgi:hypothetical protein
MHFQAFDPPTLETFAEHHRREVYRNLQKAVADFRLDEPLNVQRWLGRAEQGVSVLYDLGHPRCYSALKRWEKTRELLTRPKDAPCVYVCEECGSDDIQVPAWVSANTDEVFDSYGEDTWCPHCQDHCNMEARTR